MKDIKYAMLPDQLLTKGDDKSKVSFVPYSSREPVVKGRSSLKKHMISLITEGEKIIHISSGRQVHVSPRHILLLAAGNYLYTERFNKNEQVKSTIIFFDDDFLQSAIREIKTSKDSIGHNRATQPFALFTKDEYLHNFIQSIQSLTEQGVFTAPLQRTKLNELLMFIYSRYPGQLEAFQSSSAQRPDEERIKQIMEENLLNNLSVSELAFLCHMSLPTFKRKFHECYNQSPARWIQERRLAHAADLLRRKGAKPADVYLEAGYEHHSSFSKAFKLLFGVLPKDY